MFRLFIWLICPFIMLPASWRRMRSTARIAGTVWTLAAACAVTAAIGCLMPHQPPTVPAYAGYDVKLLFPADRYPETADHIRDAIAEGESPVCTIDRSKADAHRNASLEGVPTKKGFDRDEWPMAMCAEGGAGADIRYVTPSDNRGAGSWIGNELNSYADGTKVLIVIDGIDNHSNTGVAKPAEPPTQREPEYAGQDIGTEVGIGGNSAAPEITYRSCTDVRQAGAAPLHQDDPGYSRKLDRDGDGVACE